MTAWGIINDYMKKNKIGSVRKLAEITGIKNGTLKQARKDDRLSFRMWELSSLKRNLHMSQEDWHLLLDAIDRGE